MYYLTIQNNNNNTNNNNNKYCCMFNIIASLSLNNFFPQDGRASTYPYTTNNPL